MYPKIVALTGSPGTGKSTLAAQLEQEGVQIVTVEAVARQVDALIQHQGILEIETSKLEAWTWLGSETCVIDGHLSYYCPIDAIIVLRCNPSKLRQRLSKREGYGPEKIESNVEWEILAGVWSELITLHPKVKVLEIDTTDKQIQIESVLGFLSNTDGAKSVENSIEDAIDWISVEVTAESI